MRNTIETAPRSGNAIIIGDEANGTYEVAHWSPEAGEWIGKNGEPSKITPSHWHPLGDNYLLQGLDLSSSLSQGGPAASPGRRDNSGPFSFAPDAPRRPTASEIAAALISVAAVEAPTAPAELKRPSQLRRTFATSLIAVTLVTVTLVGMYFQAEVAASVAPYVAQQDISRFITMVRQGIAQEAPTPSQDSWQTGLLPFRQQAEPDQASAQAGKRKTAQAKHAADSAMAELRQSQQQERVRAEVLARGNESARRTVDGRVAIERTANRQIAQATQVGEATATEQPAAAEAQGNQEATNLIARANALLDQGNIGAARIVLERAAETGSAEASFRLAETYDPVVLSTWGTYGTRGETTKAREFYAKAYAGGIHQAKDRFDALRQ
jgi:hypothetical protein